MELLGVGRNAVDHLACVRCPCTVSSLSRCCHVRVKFTRSCDTRRESGLFRLKGRLCIRRSVVKLEARRCLYQQCDIQLISISRLPLYSRFVLFWDALITVTGVRNESTIALGFLHLIPALVRVTWSPSPRQRDPPAPTDSWSSGYVHRDYVDHLTQPTPSRTSTKDQGPYVLVAFDDILPGA